MGVGPAPFRSQCRSATPHRGVQRSGESASGHHMATAAEFLIPRKSVFEIGKDRQRQRRQQHHHASMRTGKKNRESSIEEAVDEGAADAAAESQLAYETVEQPKKNQGQGQWGRIHTTEASCWTFRKQTGKS